VPKGEEREVNLINEVCDQIYIENVIIIEDFSL
jgi:hypothetical protein